MTQTTDLAEDMGMIRAAVRREMKSWKFPENHDQAWRAFKRVEERLKHENFI